MTAATHHQMAFVSCYLTNVVPLDRRERPKMAHRWTEEWRWHADEHIHQYVSVFTRSQGSSLVEHWTNDQKVASSNPGRNGGIIFFSRLNFVFWLLFGVCYTPILLQLHIKVPSHSAKSAGDRLHLNTLDPMISEWVDCAAVRAKCGNLSGNELTRNLSGNTQLHSSQLTEPLWTDPGLKSGIKVGKLISTSKKKSKSAGREWIFEYSPNSSRMRGKGHYHHVCQVFYWSVLTASPIYYPLIYSPWGLEKLHYSLA